MSAPTWRVPANVAEGVKRQWPDIGPRWAERITGELAELCEHHGLTPSHVFPARYAFAVAATSSSGEPLVLRSTPDPMAAHQAAVSQALAGLDIGPMVREMITTETATWTITDRVVPGDQLATLPNNRGTFRAVSHIFGRLANQPAPRTDLPRLTDWLRKRLQDDHLADLAPNRQPATWTERKRGLEVLDDLVHEGVDGLCHGDMSSTNILLHESGRLLLIDPRGFSGEANYDAAVLMAKALGYGLSAKVVARAAKHAGYDVDRVRAWAVVALAARV